MNLEALTNTGGMGQNGGMSEGSGTPEENRPVNLQDAAKDRKIADQLARANGQKPPQLHSRRDFLTYRSAPPKDPDRDGRTPQERKKDEETEETWRATRRMAWVTGGTMLPVVGWMIGEVTGLWDKLSNLFNREPAVRPEEPEYRVPYHLPDAPATQAPAITADAQPIARNTPHPPLSANK